jgi:hypothetical protein
MDTKVLQHSEKHWYIAYFAGQKASLYGSSGIWRELETSAKAAWS